MAGDVQCREEPDEREKVIGVVSLNQRKKRLPEQLRGGRERLGLEQIRVIAPSSRLGRRPERNTLRQAITRLKVEGALRGRAHTPAKPAPRESGLNSSSFAPCCQAPGSVSLLR